jgi:hypothetical protein
MRYVLDFGSVNAGGSPAFSVWANLYTLSPLAAPALTEIGEGQYQFDYAGGETVVFKATLAGVELSDVIAPNSTPGVRNVLDFGAVNAGGSPAFSIFARLDSGAALAQPAIDEIGSGLYFFDYNFAAAPAGVTSVTFKATLAGLELSDVISAQTVPGGVGQYKAAGALINRAAVQCLLDPVEDPYASADPNCVLFRELLSTLGEELTGEAEWTQLERDATFNTVAAQKVYPFPQDFDRTVDDTGWSTGSIWPLAGPLSQQTVQALKVFTSLAPLSLPYRLQGASLVLTLDPPAGSVLVHKYLSRQWVQGAGSMEPDLDAPAQSGDLVLFDPLLIVLGLKLRWLETKGFDTTTAGPAYQRRLEQVRGANGGARTLSFGGNGWSGRFIDANNVPPTGIGG